MDLETGEWTQGIDIKENLFFHNAIAISSDEVFICCGYSRTQSSSNKKSWIYNIATETIEGKSTATYAQYGSNCAFIYLQMKAKKVVFCAGSRSPVTNKVEIFDIQENRWEVVGSFEMTYHINLGVTFVFGNR